LLVERDFYQNFISKLDGSGKGLNMDGKGYVYIGNHAISRNVLGLEKGLHCRVVLKCLGSEIFLNMGCVYIGNHAISRKFPLTQLNGAGFASVIENFSSTF